MKYLLTILSLLVIISSNAQSNTKKVPQNASQNKASSKLSSATVNSLPYPIKNDTCIDKGFSIVFYVTLDSTGSPFPANAANLQLLVNEINSKFSRICVKFFNCSTVYIPHYPYGKWNKTITEPLVKALYYTDKTINMYFVDTIKANFFNETGAYTYSAIPTSSTVLASSTAKNDIIVVEKANAIPGNNAEVLHQLGHFFGLPNTFDEINPTPAAVPPPPGNCISHEFANGTNCSSVITSVPHGDGFCDTEADPDPSNPALVFDGMGQRYIRPVDNFMSIYSTRCRFTQEQYNRMAYVIITSRLYLH